MLEPGKEIWNRLEQKTEGTGTKMDEFVYLGDIQKVLEDMFGKFQIPCIECGKLFDNDHYRKFCNKHIQP